MDIIETTFAELFAHVSSEEDIDFSIDEEYFQKKHIEIQSENGDWCQVIGMITKRDKLRVLTWSDGSTTECADKHWICVDDTFCKSASDIMVGDEILRADSSMLVCVSNELFDEEHTFYDLQIDTPSHLYQTADGIIHHNTLLAHSIARMLDVPLAITDATSLTDAGYVGDDVESVVSRLLQVADNDIKRAERGIIFIDETDKKRSRESVGSTYRDVAGECVQQGLLKLLEGMDVMVPLVGRRGPNAELVRVNTKNILFILSGSFIGLDKIVEQSLNGASGIGFGIKIEALPQRDLLRLVEPDHLVKYGMIPELVGRVPIIAALDDLDEEQLVRILVEPKNALIKQYVNMFALDNICLQFETDALVAVAKIARNRKTNGRALRGVLETRLLRTQFNLPDLRDKGVERVIVNAATITDGEEPRLVYAVRRAKSR